jgi:hypothetical protein
MDIEHIIIIRFSTIFKERGEFNNYIKDIFKDDKLEIRFDLFKKFCLWTIVNQTLINYKVIIIYDKDLPEKYYNKLFELTKDYKFIILHKWDINNLLHENNWLEEYIDKTKKYLLTSRFDDDDILNINNNKRLYEFIKNKNINKLENNVIAFSKGKFIYIEDKEDKYSISDCTYKTPGLWLTYITKIDNKINIYGLDHCLTKSKTIKTHLLNFENNYGIINHKYGNNQRIVRMKKMYKNRIEEITLENIYKIFSI